MLEHIDAETVKAILREVLPVECNKVGPANLNDIASRGGDVILVPLEGASRLGMHVPLLELAQTASILSCGIAILKAIKDRGARNQKNQQEISLELKLSLPKELAEKIDSQLLLKLIDSLVSRFLAS